MKLKTFGFCPLTRARTRNIEILFLDRADFKLNNRQYKKAIKNSMVIKVKTNKGYKRIDVDKEFKDVA